MTRAIRRRSMTELKQAVYDKNGWVRARGENMAQRVSEAYDVTADHKRGYFVATPRKPGAPNTNQTVAARWRDLR